MSPGEADLPGRRVVRILRALDEEDLDIARTISQDRENGRDGPVGRNENVRWKAREHRGRGRRPRHVCQSKATFERTICWSTGCSGAWPIRASRFAMRSFNRTTSSWSIWSCSSTDRGRAEGWGIGGRRGRARDKASAGPRPDEPERMANEMPSATTYAIAIQGLIV